MRQYVETNIIRPLESRDQYHAPYRVCWHLRDFVAGLSITEQIADAVSNSRKVLFVFSERFPESKYCQFELQLAMKRLVDTNTRCLVPMATSEGVVPRRVKQLLTYCSVESIDDTEWTKLLGRYVCARVNIYQQIAGYFRGEEISQKLIGISSLIQAVCSVI